MFLLKNKIKVAVHSGHFHPDDVFAVAILGLYLKKPLQIFRSRDPKVWAMADYICDVGGEYNPAEHKFDHHQAGYDEKRENGIVYSSAGLVWKEYGEKITGSAEIAEKIDRKIIQPVDAEDNGIDITKNLFEDLAPYTFTNYIFSFNLMLSEKNKNSVEAFENAVEEAKKVLLREIQKAEEIIADKKNIQKAYDTAVDKRIIILDDSYSGTSLLSDYPEPLFVIKPVAENNTWHANAIKKEGTRFESRLDFPKAWAGKVNKELADITGVPDAIFCHNKLFIAAAKSREGAIKLAQLALENQ